MILSALFIINVIKQPFYDYDDDDHHHHFHHHDNNDDDAEQPLPGRLEGRTFSPLWLARSESSQGGTCIIVIIVIVIFIFDIVKNIIIVIS